jgi:hypothetical protein
MWPALGVGVSGEGVALVLLIACLATGACAPDSSDTAQQHELRESRRARLPTNKNGSLCLLGELRGAGSNSGNSCGYSGQLAVRLSVAAWGPDLPVRRFQQASHNFSTAEAAENAEATQQQELFPKGFAVCHPLRPQR